MIKGKDRDQMRPLGRHHDRKYAAALESPSVGFVFWVLIYMECIDRQFV
jgi:hypothetical protein